MKKCKRCNKTFSGKHFCASRQANSDNASINNKNSSYRRSLSIDNQTSPLPSNSNNKV